MGQITEFDLGPSASVTRAFDAVSGLPRSYVNPGLAEFSYDFHSATGNLSSRSNNTYGLEERFDYDDLDRLESQTLVSGGQYLPSGTSQINMTCTDDGSIEAKTDVGTYTNEGGKTYQIADNPNTISNDQQIITYTPFNSVSTIMEGPFDATFVYGHDNQRRKMRIDNGGQTYIERYYLGDGTYERDYKNGMWRNLVYINTPTGQNAVYINDEGDQNYQLYLLDLDHLGSIVGVSDENGNLIEEYSYDPWGNRRNPETWENEYNPGQSTNLWNGLLYRGYTGHEHLDCFGLINMNGRVYDPLLGRMLSPDNFVQDATSTQSLNRFSYVFNNPLKYTDPSGEIAWAPVIIGAVIGAYIGGSMANGSYRPGEWNFSSSNTWTYMLGGAVVGGFSGYMASTVAMSGMPMANTAAVVTGSFTNSVGTHIYTGGETDVSVSLGVASYNFDKAEWGYLGKEGNSAMQNIGYGIGALANLGDLHGIYSNYKAAQHAANKGTPIDIPEGFDPEEAWKVLGTKEGYNYYGPSKTGWDPEMIRYGMGTELLPLNEVDKLAYLHDIVHYNNGTEGLTASMLSTNNATILSDFALAKGAVSILRSGVTGSVARTALSTAMGMYFLGGVHTLAKHSYYWPMIYN